MLTNQSCKSLYISEYVILKDISYLLFNIEFKTLFDHYKYVNGGSPELIQFIDIEHEDLSYQVRFTVQTKKESDHLYSKLCGLNRSKLPVCCIQTKNSESSPEDNFFDNLDNKEVLDSFILNEDFCVILNYMFPSALKCLPMAPVNIDCSVNLCNVEEYGPEKVGTAGNICEPCDEEVLSMSESGSSDGSDLCSVKNNIILPPVYKEAQYPLFYNEWMCSNKKL